jgi:fructose-1,6-bisphosphatase I
MKTTHTPPAGRTDGSSVTLHRHVLDAQRRHADARGELTVLLLQLAFAGKILSHALRRAALTGRLGLTGERNPQGEEVKKLDEFANDVLVEAFARTELVGEMISEEIDEPRRMAGGANASYVLCIDPLDGSSNSDVNGVVASIFGLYRPTSRSGTAAAASDIASGRDLAAAGYIMYGPSTVLVYSAGDGVDGFTLNHDIGEFVLTHPDMQCPARGPYFSANLGKMHEWNEPVRSFVGALSSPQSSRSLRYTGALVADWHRCLIDGGVFLYPADRQNPNGKLRLLYECAPLAFIAEKAGGAATTGSVAVLDTPIESIHQRVPLVIGSRDDVDRCSSLA